MLRIKESYDCDNCTAYDLEMAKIIRKKNGKRKLVWVHIAPCDWHGRIKQTDCKSVTYRANIIGPNPILPTNILEWSPSWSMAVLC